MRLTRDVDPSTARAVVKQLRRGSSTAWTFLQLPEKQKLASVQRQWSSMELRLYSPWLSCI